MRYTIYGYIYIYNRFVNFTAKAHGLQTQRSFLARQSRLFSPHRSFRATGKNKLMRDDDDDSHFGTTQLYSSSSIQATGASK